MCIIEIDGYEFVVVLGIVIRTPCNSDNLANIYGGIEAISKISNVDMPT